MKKIQFNPFERKETCIIFRFRKHLLEQTIRLIFNTSFSQSYRRNKDLSRNSSARMTGFPSCSQGNPVIALVNAPTNFRSILGSVWNRRKFVISPHDELHALHIQALAFALSKVYLHVTDSSLTTLAFFSILLFSLCTRRARSYSEHSRIANN